MFYVNYISIEKKIFKKQETKRNKSLLPLPALQSPSSALIGRVLQEDNCKAEMQCAKFQLQQEEAEHIRVSLRQKNRSLNNWNRLKNLRTAVCQIYRK